METEKYNDGRHWLARAIADHYGYEQQSHMMIEECSELIKAISKLEREKNPEDNPYKMPKAKNVVEETADVQIMLWQIQYLLGAEDDVYKVIDRKLNRQIERIAAEKEEKS